MSKVWSKPLSSTCRAHAIILRTQLRYPHKKLFFSVAPDGTQKYKVELLASSPKMEQDKGELKAKKGSESSSCVLGATITYDLCLSWPA